MDILDFKNEYYNQVKKIYESSFPAVERYLSVEEMVSSEDTKLYCLVDNNAVLGFMYLICFENMIFILYLAISKEYQSKGLGGYILKWCLNKFNDRKIYLNIEKVHKDADNYQMRKKRLDFYTKNGLYLTDFISEEENECFNILSNKINFDIDEYRLLDQHIAKILNEPCSTIIKRNQDM